MSPVNTWTFLLLFCISSVVYSKKCIWLQDNHKDLLSKMLNNFEHMIPENKISEECLTDITLPDTRHLYNTTQVESAAITVRELLYKIIQFYTKHQEKLVINQAAWGQLQEDLYHRSNLLKGCISRTTENNLSGKIISEYFSKLEKILEEQDDAVCARRIIHVRIKYNLLQAARLSGRIR